MILTKGEEEKLRRFERKIVGKFYGAEKLMEGFYQRLINSEDQERFPEEDIVEAIKTQKLRWYGHIRSMGEEKVVKKVTKWKPTLEEQEEYQRDDGKNKY